MNGLYTNLFYFSCVFLAFSIKIHAYFGIFWYILVLYYFSWAGLLIKHVTPEVTTL